MDATPSPASPPAAKVADQPATPGVRISPKARRLAREHGVDVAQVRGSGPDGEIIASDVLALVGNQGAQAPVGIETLGPIGRLMAERTSQSWTSVPHFFVVRDVDAAALVAACEASGPAIETARGVKPTYTDLLVALAARVLVRHPRMNASWTGDGVRLNPAVNVGVAMAVNDGVVVAVIPKADTMSLGETAVRRRDLTGRARAGQLRPSDITGATFTISNLGMYRVDSFTAIIVPPQAAILAVGRIAERVVAIDGQAAIRPMMTFTLSCDHRVADGARAATFLNELAEAIREPLKWLRV
jgi:pyruvate dehydrogenase E2 component (dihydrolipoamide acetyltransferase)